MSGHYFDGCIETCASGGGRSHDGHAARRPAVPDSEAVLEAAEA